MCVCVWLLIGEYAPERNEGERLFNKTSCDRRVKLDMIEIASKSFKFNKTMNFWENITYFKSVFFMDFLLKCFRANKT